MGIQPAPPPKSDSRPQPSTSEKEAGWKKEEAETDKLQKAQLARKEGANQTGEQQKTQPSTSSSSSSSTSAAHPPSTSSSHAEKPQQQPPEKMTTIPPPIRTPKAAADKVGPGPVLTPRESKIEEISAPPGLAPARLPQYVQATGTPSSTAEAPMPGEVSGVKELERNRGKPPLKDVLNSVIKEGRDLVDYMRRMKGTPLDPREIAKHPLDQHLPHLGRSSSMEQTAEEGADYLKRVGFTSGAQEWPEAEIGPDDKLGSSKYVPRTDVFGREGQEPESRYDTESKPVVVEVEDEPLIPGAQKPTARRPPAGQASSSSKGLAPRQGQTQKRRVGRQRESEEEEDYEEEDEPMEEPEIRSGHSGGQVRRQVRSEGSKMGRGQAGPGHKMTPQERGRKGQAVKQQHDRERMLQRGEIEEDEPTYNTQVRRPQPQPRQRRPVKRHQEEEEEEEGYEEEESLLVSPQERGRRGQAAKQRRDKERALERGEISEDEPTYYSQGRKRQGQQGQKQGRRPQQRQQYEEEEEEDEGEGEQYEGGRRHKPISPQERGRMGQAAKQRRDRERMLERGEIEEDEPTYYSQGRGKVRGRGGGGAPQRKRPQYEEEEEEDEEEYEEPEEEEEEEDEEEEEAPRRGRKPGMKQKPSGQQPRRYKRQEEEEYEEEEEEDPMRIQRPRGQMTAQEMGRKGQAMKQKRDRERMLAAGEISEDEPTYETQRKGISSRKRQSDEYDEETHKPKRLLTASEMGKRGQAAKQRRDRERMLAAGEISEDEPTYYSQGRGQVHRGGRPKQQQQRQGRRQDFEEEYDSDEKAVTLSARRGKPLEAVVERAAELKHKGFTIRINVDREEEKGSYGGGRGGRS